MANMKRVEFLNFPDSIGLVVCCDKCLVYPKKPVFRQEREQMAKNVKRMQARIASLDQKK